MSTDEQIRVANCKRWLPLSCIALTAASDVLLLPPILAHSLLPPAGRPASFLPFVNTIGLAMSAEHESGEAVPQIATIAEFSTFEIADRYGTLFEFTKMTGDVGSVWMCDGSAPYLNKPSGSSVYLMKTSKWIFALGKFASCSEDVQLQISTLVVLATYNGNIMTVGTHNLELWSPSKGTWMNKMFPIVTV